MLEHQAAAAVRAQRAHDNQVHSAGSTWPARLGDLVVRRTDVQTLYEPIASPRACLHAPGNWLMPPSWTSTPIPDGPQIVGDNAGRIARRVGNAKDRDCSDLVGLDSIAGRIPDGRGYRLVL